MSAYFKRLTEEVKSNTRAPVTEELMEYTNRLDSNPYICYPSSQNIILLLMARIKNDFNTVLYPLITHGTPLRTIMEQIRSRIVP